MKHLQSPSQLILRHSERFQQPLLLVNAPDPEVAAELQVAGTWNLHAGYHQRWQQQSEQPSHFGETPPATDAEGALLWLPKEKQLTDYLLRALASILPANAPVWLVGDNRSGIKSIHKIMPEAYAPVQRVTSGNHSLLLCSELREPSDQFSADSYLHQCELEQPGHPPLQLFSLPGVFAFPSIDKGSEMLLKHLPRWSHGNVLDFACGHGVLGAWINRAAPALEVTYLDVSAMALAACRKTLAANDLTGTLLAHDGLSPTLKKYKYMVSHPPFHTGLATDYKIGQQFLREARQHLQQTGELWLVANRFLPWPELIVESFGHCDKVAEDNRFAVYRAVNKPPVKIRERKRR
ncbi:hypothetical protein IDSA_00735 [Pseudidiomarina salinarum]|uniref:Ribosomal RNA small subunit methyltransferase C n=1 Tax=Pseudidiomarina salinarum TaxID=435908 RepID=A0A094L900_9GAMM|nr:class I SAM-dependent methyltransferase [Pseudidiomarina salinarum]KFZ31293.1 hypothetical protein IDSA_00735 [Pseudidiomarina salinarum]RUO70955.1 16S rRNA methyltransferase [Pseudidiomarina salinarum]